MIEKPSSTPPRSVASVYPALIVIAFALGMLWWSQNYSETARRFPSMVAVALACLGLIDLWSRLDLPGRAFIATFWGTSFDRREMTHDPKLRAELELALWVLGAFAGMAAVGILPALPLFCLLYTWQRAKRPLRQGIVIAVILLAFEYTVFEWLLDYELYRGLLFSKGGLSRW